MLEKLHVSYPRNGNESKCKDVLLINAINNKAKSLTGNKSTSGRNRCTADLNEHTIPLEWLDMDLIDEKRFSNL